MRKLTPIPNHHLIGHRGVAGLRPENTFVSFEYALELGLNWIELDVHLSKDQQWVVIHDESLERTSNGKGLVANHTIEELQKLDAGSWFNSKYAKQKLPSLSDVLELVATKNANVNIEIKGSEHAAELNSRLMAEFLGSYATELAYSPLVSSFDTPTIIKLRELMPDLPIGYLVEAFSYNTIDIAQENNFTSINCDVHKITEADLQRALQAQTPVLLYTINDPQQAKYWVSKGVTGIFTDRPDLLLKMSV